MSKNNFEKQVSEKLKELSIQPGDDSWLTIDKRLAQHKKRRRGIIFFLMLALIVGGSSILWLMNTQNNDRGTVSTYAKQIKTNGEIAKTKTIDKDSAQQVMNISLKQKTNTTSATLPEKENRSSKKEKAANTRRQSNVFNPMKNIITKSEGGENKPLPSNENKITGNPTKTFMILEKRDFSLKSASPITIPSKLDLAENFSFGKSKNVNKENIPDDKITNSRKWRMGLHTSGGIFSMGKSFFNNNPSNLTYDPVTVMIQGGRPIPVLSIGSQMRFNVGFDLERNISNRGILSLGIHYNLYSFTIFSQDSINFLNKIQQKSSLHYVGIPISYKLELNPNKKLPIYWSTGISFDYLIASKAWQLSTLGSLFNDNSYFKKASLGAFTGINAQILTNKKFKITAGPYIQYNISSLSGKGLYGNKHLTSVGISAEILFSQKGKK